jgi:hypothetical protein
LNITDIVAELRKERTRLDSAIAALEGIGGPARRGRKPGVSYGMATAKKRTGGITPAGRKRLSEMMKKRWAERRRKGA